MSANNQDYLEKVSILLEYDTSELKGQHKKLVDDNKKLLKELTELKKIANEKEMQWVNSEIKNRVSAFEKAERKLLNLQKQNSRERLAIENLNFKKRQSNLNVISQITKNAHEIKMAYINKEMKATSEANKLEIENIRRTTALLTQQSRERIANARLEAQANRSNSTVGVGGRIVGAARNIASMAVGGLIASPALLAVSAVASYVTDIVKGTAELNKNLSKVKAITNATTKDMKQLAETMKDVSVNLGFSTKEVADFVLTIARMGVEAENISKVSSSVAKLAKITDSDLNRAGEVVIQTMNAFEIGFENTDAVVNKMMRTLNGSALDLEKYATIMSYVSASAYEVGVSMDEAHSMVMLLANSGLKASTVGTSLRNIFGKLSEDGKSLTEVIKKLKDEQLSYSDAVALVGARGANALSILINKYEELGRLQSKSLASLATVDTGVATVEESVFVRMQKALNAGKTEAEFFANEQLSASSFVGEDADKLKKLPKQQKEAIIANVMNKYISDNISGDFEKKSPEEQMQELVDLSNTFLKDKNNKNFLEAMSRYTERIGRFDIDRIDKGFVAKTLSTMISAKNKDFVANARQNELADVQRALTKAENSGEFVKFKEENGGKGYEEAKLDWVRSKLSGKYKYSDAELTKVIQTNSTGLVTVEQWVKAYYEQEKIVKAVQKNGMKATQADIMRMLEAQGKMDEYKAKICLIMPELPLCSASAGRADTKITQNEAKISASDLRFKIKSNEARDAIGALEQKTKQSIEGIRSKKGTTEYDMEVSKYMSQYQGEYQNILDKFFGEDSVDNLKAIMQADIENLTKAISALDEADKKALEEYEKSDKGKKAQLRLSDVTTANATLRLQYEQKKTGMLNTESAIYNKYRRVGEQYQLDNRQLFFTSDIDKQIANSSLSNISAISNGSIAELEAQANVRRAQQTAQDTGGLFKKGKAGRQVTAEENKLLSIQRKNAQLQLEEQLKLEKLLKERIALIEEQKKNIDDEVARLEKEGRTAEAQILKRKGQEDYNKVASTAYGDLVSNKQTQADLTSIIETKDKEDFTKEEQMQLYYDTMSASYDIMVDMYQSYQDRMLEATRQRIEKELQAEQKKLDKENSLLAGAYELGLISQTEYANRKTENEEEFTERKNKLLKEQFEAEKDAEIKTAKLKLTQRIAEMAINVAVAESKKGILGVPFVPIAIGAYTALMTAQSAVEIASIKKKEFVPEKFAGGGMIVGNPHTYGGVPFTVGGKAGFEAEGGEYIVNKYSTSKYRRELEAINSDTFNSDSYFSREGEAVALLRQLVTQGAKPVRAYVTSNDLASDERARKVINAKTKING